MKILEVIRSIDPEGGGPVEGLKQIGAVWEKWGHTVEAVSLDPPQSSAVRGFPLKLHALGPAWHSYGFSRRLIPWLRERAAEFDVVLIDGLWAFHSYAVWRALHKSDTPYAVFTHGMLDPWFKRRYPLKHLKKWIFWPWTDYRVCRDAGAVFFTCEEERILARQSFWFYKANEVVVTYGASVPDATLASDQRAVLLELFPELRNKRLIVFVGRIHPKKGCDLAIEAFAQTAAANREYHLVFAGPDQVGWQAKLQARCKKLRIADRVTWTGSVSGDLKWGLFRTAEALLLPSHQENFGVVAAEALGCGTPILISSKVNIWRETESAGAALVAEDTLLGTCSLLRRWLELDDSAKNKMRVQARQCFLDRFEIERASSVILASLKNTADRKRLLMTHSVTTSPSSAGESVS
jgi:glycosyltransferase involved in cell wall biosynthesis